MGIGANILQQGHGGSIGAEIVKRMIMDYQSRGESSIPQGGRLAWTEMFSKQFSAELGRVAMEAGYTPTTKVTISADNLGHIHICPFYE